MTPKEASQLLAAASGLDPRMKPPSDADAVVRARLWAEVLAPSMTLGWAVKAMTTHYSRSADSLMPSHLNEQWRLHVRDQQEQTTLDELRELRATRNPEAVGALIDSVRQQLAKSSQN